MSNFRIQIAEIDSLKTFPKRVSLTLTTMTEEDQKFLDGFYQALLDQGVSRDRSSGHLENLRFFAQSFLDLSEGMEFREVDTETIEYFFTNWYPGRVKGSKTELLDFIPSLRKFYQFLFQAGGISGRTLEEISGSLSRKDYLLEKFAPGTAAAGEESDPGGSGEIHSEFWLDRSLYFLVRNLEKSKPRIILDFQLFLDYLAHHPIRLKSAGAGFPRKDLYRINQMFSEPEKNPANADQDQFRRLNLFYHLGRSLDLFLVGQSSQLLVTPRSERFLALDLDQQLVILLDALWNRVRWSELQRFGANTFAGWAQEQRGGFAELLSRVPADTTWPITGSGNKDRYAQMLLSYLGIYEVVENLIMFGLKEMGILYYELEQDGDRFLARDHRGIKSIIVTRFGRKVMRYLTRKARDEMGVESLMDLLEEGLLFL